jgi:hypothetical protein
MIAASFSKDKIVQMLDLNKHRSTYAHSIASYDTNNMALFSVNRGFGDISYNRIYEEPNLYIIVFIQEMPNGRHIQPPCIFTEPPSDHHLWFNGELAPKEIEKLQFEEAEKDEESVKQWAPFLLLKHIIRYSAPIDVDGSFACLYCDGRDLFVFRNEKEALFLDDDFNICSSPFTGSTSLASNKMYKMNMTKRKLRKIDEFATLRHWYPEAE